MAWFWSIYLALFATFTLDSVHLIVINRVVVEVREVAVAVAEHILHKIQLKRTTWTW